MTIKLDRDVEQPPLKATGGRILKYPWTKMEIGDSFQFPRVLSEETVRAMTSHAAKRYHRRFTVRRMPDDSFRCWRVDRHHQPVDFDVPVPKEEGADGGSSDGGSDAR